MDNWIEDIVTAFEPQNSNDGFITISVTMNHFTSEAKKYDKVKKAIDKRSIHTRIKKMRKPVNELFCYELMCCVEEGDHGDDEGYGVEPDIWIKAYIDLDGNFITPFHLWEEPKDDEYYAKVMRKMYSGDFAYDLDYSKDYKEAIITGYYGKDCNVVIPEVIAGRSVKKIGKSAFSCNKSIRSVVISQGVECICYNAFWRCTNLERILIPDSVTVIEEYAFYFCESLKEIRLPNMLTVVEEGVFEFCRNLQKVYFPSSIKTIKKAFSNCDKLNMNQIPKL